MSAKKEFGVLKFVERGGYCYASTHCIQGTTLAVWFKNRQIVSKEQFFSIVKELVVQLKQFHKTEGEPCHQYVNPYAFVISKEEHVFLVDMQAKENAELLKFMQKRIIREHFWPKVKTHCKKGDMKQDLYGIGRTFQYLLATVSTEPVLKKSEEQAFQKIISNCLSEQCKHPFKNCQDILKHLPKYKNNKKQTRHKTIKIVAIAMFIFFMLLYQIQNKVFTNHEDVRPIEKAKKVEPNNEEPQRSAQMELALMYLLEFKDYEKSLQLFSEIEENPLAKQYVKLINYLWKGQTESEKANNQEIKDVLKEIERLIPDKQRVAYYLSLFEGYQLLDDLGSVLEKIRIGEYCLSLNNWEEKEEPKKEKEIRAGLAGAYEDNNQLEEALAQYDKLLELETDQGVKETIFQKTSVLYEEADNREKALETCAEGLKQYPESEELHTLYIRMQCENSQISKEELVAIITKIVQERPGIQEYETFQKVQQEHGIRIEGERVWIEK